MNPPPKKKKKIHITVFTSPMGIKTSLRDPKSEVDLVP